MLASDALHLAVHSQHDGIKLGQFCINEGSWFSGRASHSHHGEKLVVDIWEGPGFDSRRVHFLVLTLFQFCLADILFDPVQFSYVILLLELSA